MTGHVDLSLLAWTQADRSSSYRAVMDVFAEEHARYGNALRPSDVASILPDLTNDDAEYLLDQLCSWGNLLRTRDELPAADLRSYEARSFVYEITTAGAAAYRAITVLEAELHREGDLQAELLTRLLVHLGTVRDQLRLYSATADRDDAAALVIACDELDHTFSALRTSSQLFVQNLNQTLSDPTLDPARLSLFKLQTIDYLRSFVDDLDVVVAKASDVLNDIAWSDIDVLLERAHTASSAPSLRASQHSTWPDMALQRLHSLRTWFLGDGARPAAALALADKAVAAVVGIVAAVERMSGAAAAPGGHAEALVDLAVRLSASATPAATWAEATGLVPARHFTSNNPDTAPLDARTSWWASAPVEVPTKLRVSGKADYVRRATKVPSYSRNKDAVAARHAAAAREAATAEASLLARSPFSLSALGSEVLARAEFDLLVSLLEVAFRSPVDQGSHQALSTDGRLALRLQATGERAQIRTGDGVLTCPDALIELALVRAGGTAPGTPSVDLRSKSVEAVA